MFYCARDVLVVVAPTTNAENVKYYLMHFTEWKVKLLENYDDNGFIYDIGSIILKGYFFQQNHHIWDVVYFQDYEPNVISYQYSHLVCVARRKLIEAQWKKKLKIKKWKMSKADHEQIIEDGIPLEFFWLNYPIISSLWIHFLELPELN